MYVLMRIHWQETILRILLNQRVLEEGPYYDSLQNLKWWNLLLRWKWEVWVLICTAILFYCFFVKCLFAVFPYEGIWAWLSDQDTGWELYLISGQSTSCAAGLFSESFCLCNACLCICCMYTGLPQRYQDTVRAIQPGLPLFLYNYSTRCLHGVFEVSLYWHPLLLITCSLRSWSIVCWNCQT